MVETQTMDSLARLELIVFDGFESKVPFDLNEQETGKACTLLIHGLGGNINQWVNPSMPYWQFAKNLTAIKDPLLSFNLGV